MDLRRSFSLRLLAAGCLILFAGAGWVQADPEPVLDAKKIYEKAEKSIVYIRAFRADGTIKTFGSGFLIGSGGQVMTAHHVIDQAARLECLVAAKPLAMPCTVTARNKAADSALLSLPKSLLTEMPDLPYLKFRQTPVIYGERVFAIGFPMKEQKIITEGIVNAPEASISGARRTLVSATIVSGMSGGPVLDDSGNVAGLISGSVRTMPGIHLVVDPVQIIKSIGYKDGGSQ